MVREQSAAILKKAEQLMPGGVSSPARLGGVPPLVIERGEGPYIWDADGERYIDYILSWGPLLLGHADPDVIAAIEVQAKKGTGFGSVTELEVQLAELITERIPAIEQLRFVNSGTEATMSAIRLARGATGREKIIKFAGGYHGHHDSVLIATHIGTDGRASAGVPEAIAQSTLVAPYNDLNAVEALFKKNDVAAVIVEPVAANMGLIVPKPDFLPGLRALADAHGALLIFDQVLMGFRVEPDAIPGYAAARPDLITLGKVIGGGLPVGAYGGTRAVMDNLAPKGPVFQGGSQSGNALGMAAGIAQLMKLKSVSDCAATAKEVAEGIADAARQAGVPLNARAVGSIFTVSFQESEPHDYESALKTDVERFQAWVRGMREHGIHLSPGALQVNFVSTAHSEETTAETIRAAHEVLRGMA